MRRLILVALLSLGGLLVGGAERTLAQTADAAVEPTTFGQFLRAVRQTRRQAQALISARQRFFGVSG